MDTASQVDHVAGDKIERAVAEVWARLLNLDRVGGEDNFLLLGGESLLATQAAAQLRDIFQCEVSVRSIFVKTVAEIATEIRLGCAVDKRDDHC